MKRSIVSQFFLFALMFVVGVLIVTQIRTHSRARTLVFRPDEQALLLSELVTANQNLRSEVESLQRQIAAYEDESGGTVLEELVSELPHLRRPVPSPAPNGSTARRSGG